MIGVEMVESGGTRKPLNATDFVDIWERSKDMGVLLGKGGINGNVSWVKHSSEDPRKKLIKFNFFPLFRPQTNARNHPKKVFRIKPPLCVTKEDADLTLNVFEGAVKHQLNN